MSLRTLPEIKAFDALAEMTFQPDDAVLARWSPEVRAADSDDASISIYDVIGEDAWSGGGVTSKRISAALRAIGERDVTVNINSPGGDFFEGTAIYSLLRDHKAKVTVRVMGLAASAASVIAMAGDEIQVSEVGFLMIHNAWGIAIGNRHDFRSAADMLEPFDTAMAGLYAKRAGVDEAEAAAWMDAEKWFNAAQAVEAGLADSIMAADLVEEDAAAAKALAAVRRVDLALAKQGMSRSERRALLGEMKGGKPGAAASAMHDAGDDGLSASLADLLSTVKA